MRSIDIKSEIKRLIDRESDKGILEAIRTLLEKTTLNPALKSKLTNRAQKSNEDIKAGRILSREEIEARTNK